MEKDKILEEITKSNLPEKTKNIISTNLVDRYIIETTKSDIQIGESKIGGFPHLPKQMEYPQESDYYYEFIAQIKLSDLAYNNIPNLPNEGMLYFFVDDDFNVGNVNAKVIHIKNLNELEIKHPPVNKKSRCELCIDKTEKTELKLTFEKSLTINQKLLDEIVNEFYNVDINLSFNLDTFYTRDQIWGYTTTWGFGDTDWCAYLAKNHLNGLYWFTRDYQIANLKKDNINIFDWLLSKIDEKITHQKDILLKYDKAAYIYPYFERELVEFEFAKQNLSEFVEKLEFHKSESKKWHLLLALSSYQEAEIQFGDGKIEFHINLDDLVNQNFENIYCCIYN